MKKEPILSVKDLGISFSQYTKGLRRRELEVITNLDIDLYEGEIPDGDTFDATCTFKNSNNVVYSITFKADGTYVQDDNGDVSEGTYTRDGDWIKRESSSGTSVGIDYLIYSGRITNSYYIKK